jgi:tetratricopeptide (TPR) repeat protein
VVVLGRFLRALGVGEQDVPQGAAEAAERFRALTADRRLLVVLDNAHDAVQVRPLLPAGPGCAVLVTSRQVLATLDGATHLHLDVLPAADAVDLLARLAGAQRVAADENAAHEVARLCGCLPLAVRIAGARLAARPGWPVRVVAERRGDAQRRLDELQLADLGVRASFRIGYQSLEAGGDPLDQGAARAFPMLGLLDGPDFGVPAVARLLDRPEPEAEQMLERLVDGQLLESAGPGRYRLHDLMRLYAREEAHRRHPVAERAAALTRTLAWFAATAWAAFRLLRPGDQRPVRAAGGADAAWARVAALPLESAAAAMDWLEAERRNLVAAVRQAADTPEVPPELAIVLAQALFAFFLVRGHWDEWIEVNRTALTVARRLGDRIAQAHAWRDLGTVHERRGEYETALACLNDALVIFRAFGDRYGQATTLHGLGVVQHRVGRFDDAVAHYEESVAIRRELGDRYGQGVGLANLGMIHASQRRYGAALTAQRSALAIFEELGERGSQAISLTALGEVYQRKGYYADALACHERSLALLRMEGNRAGEATALNNLGQAHLGRGEHAAALSCYRQALAILEPMGERYEQAECLQHIGSIRYDLGQYGQARAHWRRALSIFEELGVRAADDVRALLAAAAS